MHKTLFWTVTLIIIIGILVPAVGEGTGSANILHFISFLAFSYLLSRAYSMPSGHVIVISVFFGLFTELLQLASGYRVFSVTDWHYNNMGSLAGVGIFYLRTRYHDFIYR